MLVNISIRREVQLFENLFLNCKQFIRQMRSLSSGQWNTIDLYITFSLSRACVSGGRSLKFLIGFDSDDCNALILLDIKSVEYGCGWEYFDPSIVIVRNGFDCGFRFATIKSSSTQWLWLITWTFRVGWTETFRISRVMPILFFNGTFSFRLMVETPNFNDWNTKKKKTIKR